MKKITAILVTMMITLNVLTLHSAAIGSAGFLDVPADAYYSEPVLWAVKQNITSGVTETAFGPDVTCTRAQILTLLWHAVGSPVSSIKNPFADVREQDFYYQSALWAYEKGMIAGTSFAGNTPCTRLEAVTYQWKLAGSPTGYRHHFRDVSAHSQAVAWAVEEGITSGTSATTFSPDETCTRAQIVTFLWRDLAEKTLYRNKSVNTLCSALQCAKTGTYLSYSGSTLMLGDTPTKWQLKPAKDGLYYVYADGTTSLLDIHNAWIKSGTMVKLWGMSGYDAQIWKVANNADGSVSLLSSQDSSLCLGFSNGSASLETRCAGNQYQEFRKMDAVTETTQWREITSDDGTITLQLEERVFDILSPQRLVKWANDLSTAYDMFEDLTNYRPYDHVVLRGFESQQSYAFVTSNSNVIYYDKDRLYVDLEKMAVRDNDWCFGALHEMGHMFDRGKPWNFEAECLTQIKVPYVMELCAAAAVPAEFSASTTFVGDEIIQAYDRLGESFSSKYNYYGLAYRFMEIKNEIGWEPFQQTFHYMQANCTSKQYTTDAQRWDEFIALLSQFSGRDVLSYFTDAEVNCILEYID